MWGFGEKGWGRVFVTVCVENATGKNASGMLEMKKEGEKEQANSSGKI